MRTETRRACDSTPQRYDFTNNEDIEERGAEHTGGWEAPDPRDGIGACWPRSRHALRRHQERVRLVNPRCTPASLQRFTLYYPISVEVRYISLRALQGQLLVLEVRACSRICFSRSLTQSLSRGDTTSCRRYAPADHALLS